MDVRPRIKGAGVIFMFCQKIFLNVRKKELTINITFVIMYAFDEA